MKKRNLFFFALMLTMLSVTDAMAQKIYRAELDKSMFKAWTDHQPGASVVEEPAAIDGGTFNCETNFFKQLEGGNVVFGNHNVYYLWYADLTGTQKITIKGTSGLTLRVLMNRPEPVEGGDAHGGATVERQVTIGSDGMATLDVSDLSYVHLNCIKVNWGGSGIVKEITITGTVKPVTGILSVINNGDAEGNDLESFHVSFDGPNNGGTANERPEIINGGVSGKCFKVTSYPDPTETWHTQFFIKADEVMPRGSKWMLKMDIKADRACSVTTTAQAQPRSWKGSMGIDEFGVSTEWQNYTWSGEIGVDDFQSIGFDLNNEGGSPGNGDNAFYFDNIEFGYDLGGTNPISEVSITAASDKVCINFGSSNIKDLVNASPSGKTLVYDNSCATVTLDGEEVELVTVEARPDGNLYIFHDGDEIYDDTEVKVAFKNPTDAAHKIIFGGKYEGQAVPDFSGVVAEYDEELAESEIHSIKYDAAALETISPEAGSFNMTTADKEFVVTFNQEVNAATVIAKLGAEDLAVSPAEGMVKTVTLTRTATTEIVGAVNLVISKADNEFGAPIDPIVVKYSYGPVDESAQPEIIYASNFTGEGENANGAGWIVNSDTQGEMHAADSGSGCRLQHGKSGFAADVLYLAQRSTSTGGVALYGTEEGHALNLEAKEYHLTLDVAQWDAYENKRALKVQVLPLDAVDASNGSIIDEDAILAEDFKEVIPEFNNSKEATKFDIAFTVAEAGSYVIRMVPSKPDGSFNGYSDGCAIGNIKVMFIPDVLGIIESQALADALQSAKETYEDLASNEEDRYTGEDLTALQNLISEVEAGKAAYTAPSLYTAKAEELAAKAKAANDHKSACDSYDENIKKAIDMVLAHANDKFNQIQTYADLKAIAAKYHAVGEQVNLAGDDEEPVYETNYIFDLLKDNAQLAAANEELKAAVSLGNYIFTTVDLDRDIQQGNCGIAVLVERNRLGARALKSLGVPTNDPIFAKVDNSITDSETLADEIKTRIKTILYTEMAKGDNGSLFIPSEDDFDIEGNPITPSYDMTVFIKNPNIYCLNSADGFTDANVPGWTSPTASRAYLFTDWSGRGVANLPEDCAFTTWFGTNRMEQTITDLPAGIYVVSLCGSDWSNQAGNADNPHDVNGFVYCKTSDTPAVEEDAEEDRELNFAATRTIVYGGLYNMDHPINLGYAEVINEETGFISTDDGEFFGIPVTDGKLTIGIHFGGDAHYFFQHARLTLVAPLEGFDYAAALKDIEPVATNLMGDVNHDKAVDVTDAVLIIDNILEKNPANFDASLADVNSDSEIDVTDVVMVIDAILGKINLSRTATFDEAIDKSAYTAFQMDFTIPAGYVFEGVSLTDIAKDSHTLAYNMLPNGRCRVVVCSMNNEALPGAWDEVIRLHLRGLGETQVNIDRAVFVTIAGERHELTLNGTTAIAEISNLKPQTSNLYDLQGRKVEKTTNGLYIIDRKKVIK